jgi:hypothetical protein
MFERRRFVTRFVVTAMSSYVLSIMPSSSLSLESTVKQQLDSAFSEAIRRVAEIRETNRSTGLDVTHQFDRILETYSLADFQAYLAMRYGLERVKTGLGNEDYTYLDDKTLKEFDKRFLRYDRLTVGFMYSSDWKDIIEFRASLVNLVP